MLALETISESTLSQTSSYNDSIIVNVLESILRTSQKTITIDVKGKQSHPKQIIFYRGDATEADAQLKYADALNFAEVFIALFNEKFGKAPLGTAQLSGITIREQGEDGVWCERQVNLITLHHPESTKVSFLRLSAMYYRGIA